MKSFLLSAAAFVLAGAPSAQAAATKSQAAAPATVQVNKARIDRALAEMVAGGRVVGASALLWKNGREVYFGTAGQADREGGRPIAVTRSSRSTP